MKMFSKWLLIIAFISPAITFAAAQSCKAIFDLASKKQNTSIQQIEDFQVPSLLPYTDGLSASRLTSQGFKIKYNSHLVDISSGSEQMVGKLRVIQTNKLFQWAEPSYQKSILEHGGITKDWMDTILNSTPQGAGFGFYVSTHPFDSKAYGSALTVFDVTKKTIVLLEPIAHYVDIQGHIPSRDTISNKKYVQRLKKAGISGFRASSQYQETWMGVIDESILLNPRTISLQDISSLIKMTENHDVFQLFLNKLAAGLFSNKDIDNFGNIQLKAFLKRKINTTEAVKLISESDLNDLTTNTHIISAIHKSIENAKSFEDLLPLMMAIMSRQNMPENFHNPLISSYSNKKADSITVQKNKTILDIYDIRAVADLSKYSSSEQKQKLNEFTSAANKYDQHFKKLNFSSPDSASFIKLAELVYGIKFKFREDDYMMSLDPLGENLTIPLSNKAYQVLSKNPFLDVEVIKKNNSGTDPILAEINYPNAMKILKITGQKLQDYTTDGNNLMMNVARSFLDGVLAGRNARSTFPKDMLGNSPFENYKLFLSLHPFEDGNGRFARLLFRKLSQNKAERGLTIPVYDLDLVLTEKEFMEQSQIGVILRTWVAHAKNNQDFIERAQKAFDWINLEYPHLSSLIDGE